jgi:hypothetical protein
MPNAARPSSAWTTAAFARAIFFLAFWLVLTGFVLADLPAGACPTFH